MSSGEARYVPMMRTSPTCVASALLTVGLIVERCHDRKLMTITTLSVSFLSSASGCTNGKHGNIKRDAHLLACHRLSPLVVPLSSMNRRH